MSCEWNIKRINQIYRESIWAAAIDFYSSKSSNLRVRKCLRVLLEHDGNQGWIIWKRQHSTLTHCCFFTHLFLLLYVDAIDWSSKWLLFLFRLTNNCSSKIKNINTKKTAFFLPLELHFDYHKKTQKYVWDKLINQIIVIFILCTHSPPWQRCTGLRWIKTWWCLEMRRASWSVTGSTPATPPASFPSPGPSSASPAPLTPGALWLWGEKTTQSPVHSAGSRL